MKHLPAFITIGFFFFSCVGTVKSNSTLTVVDSVDLQRYLGQWYEIASYPAWFQKGCAGSTAEYSLLSDGKIQVVNRCRKDSLDGPLKESKGKAEIVDTATNAKLKVWFFWPFKGNYWIIDLDPDYQWAVVGEPSRKYLWILSRTPSLDEATYQEITERLPQKGYDPDYQWAVVGEPSRKYLWILSRTPSLDEATYQEITERLPQKGYDPAKLRQTAQVDN